jgi:predicted phage terminase large subunit-like protein
LDRRRVDPPKQMEYPDLKRAVRDQHRFYAADVVLIEDKASGTPLIQGLIREGVHTVKGYKPKEDKTMRMHTQTGMIENGFVHLPVEVPWLAEYLHEMTVFPNGRYDDQADSTAQMLDWFKLPFPGQNIYELYRRQYEKLQSSERISTFQLAKSEYARGSMEWQAEQQKKKENDAGP